MKSTTAIMQKTIDAVFEGFALDDKGRLVEINKEKAAESDAHFKKFFLEFARDMWDEAEMNAHGIDAGINNVEFQQAAADPTHMTFDIPAVSPTPQAAELPDQPELNSSASGGMAGAEGPLAPQAPMMDPSAPPSNPALPESDDLDSLFDDIPDPELDGIFALAEDELTEFRPMGNEFALGQNNEEEPGFGDMGSMEGQMPGMDQMDQGMQPMSHSMGGDMGAMGMNGGADNMMGMAHPGQMGGDMGAPGMGGDQTMGLDGGMDGGGMDFDFDLDTLGFGDGEAGDVPGDLGGEEFGMGDEEQPGDDLSVSDDGISSQPPAANVAPAMGESSTPRGSKVAVVPAGKPKSKNARPGLPAKDKT